MTLFRQSWSRWIFILTLTGFLGAHWWILQSFTWVAMLGERLHSEPAPVALSRIFQKKYACKYCKAIEEGRQQEEASKLPLVKGKLHLDMLLPHASNSMWFSHDRPEFPAPVCFYQCPLPQLTSPPPRSV